MNGYIWVPSGNSYQTEIDRKISEALFWVNKAENDIQYHKLHLHKYKEKLNIIEKALSNLKVESNIAISMKEYNEMIKDKNDYKMAIAELDRMINTCQEFVTYQKKIIDKLEIQRKKLETKIIKFKARDE